MAGNDRARPAVDVPGTSGDALVPGGAALEDAADVEDITILFVDDERQLLSVLAENLKERIGAVEIVTASNATEAIERLERLDIDCIVSDYKMPGSDGLDLLERCRELDPTVPFILYTSKGSEDIAERAINADVTDYLQKDLGQEQLTLLANRIQNAVSRRRVQEAAAATLQHVSRIHERVSDAYLGLDDHWEITYIDGDASRLLQDSRENLLGRSFWDALPDAVDSPFETQFQRALDEDTAVDFEAYYEPFEVWFDVRAFPSEDGLSVYFRDITERKRLQDELEAVSEGFERLEQGFEDMAAHTEELVSLAEAASAACTCEDDSLEALVAEIDNHLEGVRNLAGGSTEDA